MLVNQVKTQFRQRRSAGQITILRHGSRLDERLFLSPRAAVMLASGATAGESRREHRSVFAGMG
jgi:hypothetical protein